MGAHPIVVRIVEREVNDFASGKAVKMWAELMEKLRLRARTDREARDLEKSFGSRER